MSFQSLSDEEIAVFAETAEKIAEQVAKNSLECTANRINIVGPRASLGEQKHGYFVDRGETQTMISGTNKNSFILNGLEDANIVINGKVNHVLIRECYHTKIRIGDGVISGITILKGRKVTVELPIQNTTSFEQTLETMVSGQVTSDTIIYVVSSQDIFINNENLHVHPFVQGVFNRGYFFTTRYIPPELQTLTDNQVVRIQV